MTPSATAEFGHAMRSQFLFDNKWINLNHGSFGTYPVPVRNAKRGYSKLTEAAPDKFLRYQFVDLLQKSRERIAAVLNAPVDECVFVPNVTSGLNTILRNLVYQEKDTIIYFDTVYGAIEKTLLSVQEVNPQLQLRKVGHGQDDSYELPMTHPEICSAFSQTISRLLYEGHNVKAAVFDTIVSLPGVRLPFERLVKMCKEYGILSIVDGAHAVGQIPLDLGHLEADFFVSSCHKWLYTPRGCAVIHVPKRNQYLIRTTFPTSWGYVPKGQGEFRSIMSASGVSDFVGMFQFVATLDNTPYYCVPAALNFRQNICGGEQAIYNYIRDIAQRGADMVAMLLGTEVMDDLDPGDELKAMGPYEAGPGQEQFHRIWAGGLRDCAMANVLLPISIAGTSQSRSDCLGPEGAGSGEGLITGLNADRRLSSGHHSPSGSRETTSPSSTNYVEPIIIQKGHVPDVVTWMEHRLTTEYNTFVCVFDYKGKLWTRVSGQVYLELKDFEWLGGILRSLCGRVGAGEAFKSKLNNLEQLNKTVELDLEKIGQAMSKPGFLVENGDTR